MNGSKSSKLVESVKSILLVVLFSVTILLLYFFWGDTPFRNLMGETPQSHEAIDPVEIFQPDRIEISFGGGDYTVTENQFQTIMDSFRAFSESGNLSVEEISKERYEHEVIRRMSIKAVFEYYIPFGAVCELYGIVRITGADAIEAVSELAYAADSDSSLFVYDKWAEKYFRIAGRRNSGFDVLKQIIEDAQTDFVPYHTVATFMGGGINNTTLWPFSFESNLYDTSYSREDFPGQPDRVNDIVRSFFSDHFDFVRRIAEQNGTVIYMYGFGRVVVVAHNNGILEFKREDDDRPAAPLRYLEAFERANSFIAAHGGFSPIDGMPLTPYIKEVIIDPEGKRGYRFVFGVKAEGARVYYQNGAPMEVDVIGDRVTSFKRQLINVDPNALREADNGYREVFLPVINLIAFNTDHIGAALAKTQSAEALNAEELSFEMILEKVTRLDAGYVKINENEEWLKAAWIVTIDDHKFFFGLDDGVPL